MGCQEGMRGKAKRIEWRIGGEERQEVHMNGFFTQVDGGKIMAVLCQVLLNAGLQVTRE